MELVLTALLTFAGSFAISHLLTGFLLFRSGSSRRKYFARGYSAGWNDHSACVRQQNHEEEASK